MTPAAGRETATSAIIRVLVLTFAEDATLRMRNDGFATERLSDRSDDAVGGRLVG
jgi:hypothetical protein